MVDAIDDELQIMKEQEQESPALMEGVHLEDPIEALELRDPITVSPDTSVLEAFKLMTKHDIGCLLITNKKGKLQGIITERDLIRKACTNCNIASDMKVSSYMTEKPDTLRADDPMVFALNRMCEHNYRHVPIVKKNRVAAGVVSIRDIVKHVGACFHKEIANLPPKPVRKMRRRFAG
ncbi:MAG: CBS domain-containing protein [Candidatus Marinimicrobia bacterium]|nr:CBS domain-containing protein [Candidatus Neomarinimicrobiota bacterium]